MVVDLNEPLQEQDDEEQQRRDHPDREQFAGPAQVDTSFCQQKKRDAQGDRDPEQDQDDAK